MALKLFTVLYEDRIICKDTFNSWKDLDTVKPGFDDDLEIKTITLVLLNSFFLSLAKKNSVEIND